MIKGTLRRKNVGTKTFQTEICVRLLVEVQFHVPPPPRGGELGVGLIISFQFVRVILTNFKISTHCVLPLFPKQFWGAATEMLAPSPSQEKIVVQNQV